MSNPLPSHPLVSVVIATYNGERFLRQQLDSLFSQTYTNLEIIAIDDCSSDSSVQILNEYAAVHLNMKVFENESNMKSVKTFERGALLASGDFINFCDQDDIWNQQKIAESVSAWESGTGLVYCDSLFIDENGNSLGRKLSDIKILESHSNPLPFLIGNCVSGHAALYSRQLVLEAIPFPNDILHDWWLAFVVAATASIKFIDQPLVQYRQHQENVIGAIKTKGRKKKVDVNKNQVIRGRISAFNAKCPTGSPHKKVIQEIDDAYATFSLKNNLKRIMIFFKYRHLLLATKKRSSFRKWLFCLKMFVKII